MSEPSATVSLRPVAVDDSPERPIVLWITALGLAVLYWAAAATTIQGGDSGELTVVAFRGGVPHPSGYPLYVLLSRLFAGLLPINPALSLSLLSAVCGVAAILVLYAGMRRCRISAESALVCAMVFGITPVYWRYSAVAEVFSLGALMAALVFWSAGPGRGPRGLMRSLLLGLFLGLGLSNHQTIIALAPLVVLGIYRALSEYGRPRALVPLTFTVGVLIGLLPYITLLGEARQTGWYWGGGLDSSELIQHFLRRDYGTASLGIFDQPPGLFENQAVYLRHLAAGFAVLTPFGLWGAFLLARSARRLSGDREAGLDAIALLASFLLVFGVLFSLFNLKPEGLAVSVIERFYILPHLLFAVFCGVGVEHLLNRERRARPFARPFAVAIVCIMALAHVGRADWSTNTTVEDYLLNALDTVPPRSAIIGTGDLQLFGFLAVSEVYAYRTDVVYIDLNLLRHRWYFDRIARALPDSRLPYDPELTHVVEVIDALLAHGHNVFVASLPPEVEILQGPQFFSYPIGPLLRVIPVGQPLPSPFEVERLNRELFARMRFGGRPPSHPHNWAALSYSYYARTWNALAGVYDDMGESERAAFARDQAAQFAVTD